MQESKFSKVGLFFIVASAYLLAISVPSSIALDNIALTIGGFGILLLLLSKDVKNFPSFKPLLFTIIPDILTMISQFSLTFLSMSSINQHLLAYFIPYKAFKEKQKIINSLFIVLGVAAIMLFLSLLFQAITWQNIKHLNIHHIVLHHTLFRANGFLNNPLTTASVVVLLLFLFFGLFVYTKKPFYFIVSVFSFFSLILAQSRSSWLGFIIASVFLSIFLLKQSKKFSFIAIILTSLFVSIMLSNTNFKSRFLSSFSSRRNYNRIIIWNAYIKVFKNYSFKQKLFGSGKKTRKLAWEVFPESFKEVTKKKGSIRFLKVYFCGGISHNIYLRFLDETGIIGLLGYILFWLYIFKLNISAFNKENGVFLMSLSAGYIAFLIIGIFENNFMDATVKIALMFVLSINFYLLDQNKPYAN